MRSAEARSLPLGGLPEESNKLELAKEPTKEAAEGEVERLSSQEKKQLARGLANLGYLTNELKAKTFGSILDKTAKLTTEGGTMNRFLKAYSQTYEKDATRARKMMEKEELGKLQRLSGASILGGNILRYGRMLYDLNYANPLRHVTVASMFLGRGLEAAKGARLANEKVTEKTRIADIDQAAEEAWKLYEKAKGEGKKVKSAEIAKAYRENLSKDLIERLKKKPDGVWSRINNFIIGKDIAWAVKRIDKKLEAIDESIKKEPDKEKKKILQSSKEIILEKNKEFLNEMDSMVGQAGTVDLLAYCSRQGEKGAKALVMGMTIDTVARLPGMLSHVFDMIGSAEAAGLEGSGVVVAKVATKGLESILDKRAEAVLEIKALVGSHQALQSQLEQVDPAENLKSLKTFFGGSITSEKLEHFNLSEGGEDLKSIINRAGSAEIGGKVRSVSKALEKILFVQPEDMKIKFIKVQGVDFDPQYDTDSQLKEAMSKALAGKNLERLVYKGNQVVLRKDGLIDVIQGEAAMGPSAVSEEALRANYAKEILGLSGVREENITLGKKGSFGIEVGAGEVVHVGKGGVEFGGQKIDIENGKITGIGGAALETPIALKDKNVWAKVADYQKPEAEAVVTEKGLEDFLKTSGTVSLSKEEAVKFVDAIRATGVLEGEKFEIARKLLSEVGGDMSLLQEQGQFSGSQILIAVELQKMGVSVEEAKNALEATQAVNWSGGGRELALAKLIVDPKNNNPLKVIFGKIVDPYSAEVKIKGNKIFIDNLDGKGVDGVIDTANGKIEIRKGGFLGFGGEKQSFDIKKIDNATKYAGALSGGQEGAGEEVLKKIQLEEASEAMKGKATIEQPIVRGAVKPVAEVEMPTKKVVGAEEAGLEKAAADVTPAAENLEIIYKPTIIELADLKNEVGEIIDQREGHVINNYQDAEKAILRWGLDQDSVTKLARSPAMTGENIEVKLQSGMRVKIPHDTYFVGAARDLKGLPPVSEVNYDQLDEYITEHPQEVRIQGGEGGSIKIGSIEGAVAAIKRWKLPSAAIEELAKRPAINGKFVVFNIGGKPKVVPQEIWFVGAAKRLLEEGRKKTASDILAKK